MECSNATKSPSKTTLIKWLITGAAIIVVLVMIIAKPVRMANSRKQYVAEAENILYNYGIEDADISIAYAYKYSDYNVYYLNVDSPEIEELSDSDIYEIVKSIDSINIYVKNRDYLVLSYVSSGGNSYSIDVLNDNILEQNGADIYNNALQDKTSMAFKVEVYQWIEDRYEYYDSKDGKYTGDKYTDTIFSEAASHFGVSESKIKEIWSDYDVALEAWG
ncbi:MAG: hypothetical protein LUF68_01085 [Clostridiales bacterium]|nr:hypothetical protein [Clostridiales bacterium]MCD8117468.1 hypothetical protein [Oscillospiraceae bacterium]